MPYYHVDRLNQLTEGAVLLPGSSGPLPVPLANQLMLVFPDALLSPHGDRYLRKEEIDLDLRYIEMIFEYERCIRFPERPSRFRSWFACETIEEAREFGEQYNQDKPFTIWETEAPFAFRGDMTLLNAGVSSLAAGALATLYWMGLTDPDPNHVAAWEYLLVPPVSVGRCVERVGVGG